MGYDSSTTDIVKRQGWEVDLCFNEGKMAEDLPRHSGVLHARNARFTGAEDFVLNDSASGNRSALLGDHTVGLHWMKS